MNRLVVFVGAISFVVSLWVLIGYANPKIAALRSSAILLAPLADLSGQDVSRELKHRIQFLYFIRNLGLIGVIASSAAVLIGLLDRREIRR
ncbi:MAG: hypothetical protein AAFX08_08575 [Pseudomonadota bacterium]